jgi:hypothetical protein
VTSHFFTIIPIAIGLLIVVSRFIHVTEEQEVDNRNSNKVWKRNTKELNPQAMRKPTVKMNAVVLILKVQQRWLLLSLHFY